MKKRILVAVIILTVSSVFVLSLGKNFIARLMIERIVRAATGCHVITEDVDVSLIKTSMAIKELLVLNPKTFSDRIMLDIPIMYIDFNIPALIKKESHINEMRIHLKEFVVIISEKGELNLSALKVVRAQRENKRPQEIGELIAPDIKIDRLDLKIEKVTFRDYSKGPKTIVKEFNINLHEAIQGEPDLYSVIRIMVVEAIRRSALEEALNINLGLLTKPILKTLETAIQIKNKTVEVTRKTATQTAETVSAAIKSGQKALQEPSKKAETEELTKPNDQ